MKCELNEQVKKESIHTKYMLLNLYQSRSATLVVELTEQLCFIK